MKPRLYLLALLLAALVIVSGCGSGGEELEIRLAPIHEIRVNIAESYPPQVFVYIKGGLVDACTTFHELTVERSGDTIEIEVTTQRPKGAVCAQVYSFFEQNVALGSEFTSGKSYTVRVNDQVTSFLMP
ncbi:MAG TPA: hypothetical protein G4O01_05695 [Dehalococcoidia bacterium]|jgi:inhibitor of cysteine peptidase|nr:hypothetical protein [Dehalococcoidia bacterium]